MNVNLTFHRGRVLGDGSDGVGPFTIEGRYTVESRECTWSKRYDTHEVAYRGFAEDGSIWGVWSIRDSDLRGGFQLWPTRQGDLAEVGMTAHADVSTS